MSVYTELVRIGLAEESAQAITEAVERSHAVVTTKGLDVWFAHVDTRLAHLETRLTRTIITTMLWMTGIFAFYVAVLAWVISR